MREYDVSIRCYYDEHRSNTHHQRLKLAEIRKWVEAYSFTHPACQAVSIKIWLKDEGNSNADGE